MRSGPRRRGRQTSTGSPVPIDVTFFIGGRRTALEAIENAVDKVMCRAASNRVQRRLGHVVCPEHQQPPRVTLSGPSADQLSPSVEGCCQALTNAATQALHAPDVHRGASPSR